MTPNWILLPSRRLFARMTGAYPKSFRVEYGNDVLEVFDTALIEAWREQSVMGVLAFWCQMLFDWSISMVKAYRVEASRLPGIRLLSSALIFVSAVLWTSIAFAFLGFQGIGTYLDKYTFVCMTLAFGAPLAALSLNLVPLQTPELGIGSRMNTSLALSAAFSTLTWGLLVGVRVFHLV
jgi:hypothetical protein